MNLTITIFLSLFLPSSLSLLFVWFNPLFSLPTILSASSHTLSHPVFAPPSFPNLLPHYPSLLHTDTCWLCYCTNHTHS
jgi:hypothetical protein